MKYNLSETLKGYKDEMHTRNRRKAHMHVPGLESEWSKFLQEWKGYSPELLNIIPPTEQIKPLVEHMMKEKILYEQEFEKTGIYPLGDRKPKILGYGKSGIAIQKIYDDWHLRWLMPALLNCKLGHELNKEYDMLKDIKDVNKKRTPKHFPFLREDRCLQYNDKITALVMENDFGMTADNYAGWGNILRKHERGYKEVFNLGLYVLEALKEMNDAGIKYHRDIRPQNILITDGYETLFGGVTLLDLEYAVRSGNPSRTDGNRTFGGLNDFISLGQVLYYVATEESLFASKKGKDRFLRDISHDDIKQNRDRAYTAEGRIDTVYLEKVEKKISYKNLVGLINVCLTAKHDEFDKVYDASQKVSG